MNCKEFIDHHKIMVDTPMGESVCMLSLPNVEKACEYAVKDFAEQLLHLSPEKALEFAENVVFKVKQ